MSQSTLPEIPRYVRPPYGRDRLVTETSGDSLTDATLGNDTNINKIIERCRRDRTPLPGEQAAPVYMDVSSMQADLEDIITRGDDAKAELAKLKAEQAAARERALQPDNAEKPPADDDDCEE